MEKISLRMYLREIENLIDQGGTNEAIAHCRHILTTFPKHIEAYRLLGKSYLEGRRYDEAVDIFSRVLMSVPDDFVSHVGMSIIRDEERKLDDAIWHMERAFESQPSNPAIQGELQRLYGRRDGMEPPKVRMTRGALAHMYMQGELYPQAIAETRAVLSQDPQRADMQVLLARAYFKSGQRADASEMCRRLLTRYPYCLDANRILLDLSPARNGGSDSEVFHTRVNELDPYATFVKGSVFQSNEVADNAITIEKHQFTGEEIPMGQEWNSSLGIGLTTASAVAAEQPEWLKGFSADSSESTAVRPDASTIVSKPKEEIPDFLREAGWSQSTGPEQPTSIFESGDETLSPVEMPDWLKSQMPDGSIQPFGSIQAGDDTLLSSSTPGWLSGLEGSSAGQPATPTPSADMPDWLNGLGGPESDASTPEPGNEVPDWLQGSVAVQPAQAESFTGAEGPDWLSGLGASDAPAVEPSPSPTPVEAPDWLAGLGQPNPADSVQAEEVPDWLSELGRGKSTESASAPAAESPDWPRGMASDQPPESFDAIQQSGGVLEDLSSSAAPGGEMAWSEIGQEAKAGPTEQEQEDGIAWLESLAAKHGAKPEELVSDPSRRSDSPPPWIEQERAASTSGDQALPEALGPGNAPVSSAERADTQTWLDSLASRQGATQEPAGPAPRKSAFESVPPGMNVEQLGSSAEEQDDAIAWLEALAAKHGAKPEELITDPEKRKETPPDWVQQTRSAFESQPPAPVGSAPDSGLWSPEAKNIGEQFFAEFEGTAGQGTQEQDETGLWLKQKLDSQIADQEAAPPAELPQWIADKEPEPSLEGSDLPDWLQPAQDEKSGASDFIPKVEHMSQSDLADWLGNLDEEPKVTPEPTSSDRDLPDWLSHADEEAPIESPGWTKPPEVEAGTATGLTEETALPAMESDLPAWLKGVDQPMEEMGEDVTPRMPGEEKPSAEKLRPKPTEPSDWQPMERMPPSTVRFADLSMQPPRPKPKTPERPSHEPTYEPIDEEFKHSPQVEKETPITPTPIGRPRVQPPAQPVVSPPVRSAGPSAVPVPATPPAATEKVATVRKGSVRVSAPQPVSSSALNQAKDELDRGDIPAALEHYGKLIKKGKHLEETIRDLNDSIYRYPVEVGIWQTLGDAYMRANRLKEALEAYNKAEELIR
ncbi:MAG: tetratricopeptide repeat protein [Chloroflexi bacterium]|nr:tetratricopeptide repeat protein [Chloroflexota bacterium]